VTPPPLSTVVSSSGRPTVGYINTKTSTGDQSDPTDGSSSSDDDSSNGPNTGAIVDGTIVDGTLRNLDFK